MYSSGITVIWHAQGQLVDFILRLYMYSSGITVIWHAQGQLVDFVLRLYMYSSGITFISVIPEEYIYKRKTKSTN
jgi:hypothetical protein